jgi:ribosome-binding protein aMBF1 (putative translation factor)
MECTICGEVWSPTYYIHRVGASFAVCCFCTLAIEAAKAAAIRAAVPPRKGTTT